MVCFKQEAVRGDEVQPEGETLSIAVLHVLTYRLCSTSGRSHRVNFFYRQMVSEFVDNKKMNLLNFP